MKLNSDQTSLRLSFFFIAVLAIVFPFVIANHEDRISVANLLSAIGISGCVFLIPSIFRSQEKWFLNEGAILLYILGVLTLSSKLLGDYATLLTYPILLITIWGIFFHLKNVIYNKVNAFLFITGLLVAGFIILLTYCTYHKWCYMDNIYSGNVHIDILFHSAICNSFDLHNTPSTLIDGDALFKYHWGSHFLFNSLKNIIGISGYQFYNLIYPAVFIPLFIYSIFIFIESYFFKLKLNIYYLYFIVFALIAIYFSLDKFSYIGQPVGSESFTLSLMYCFLSLSVLFCLGAERISFFQILFFACCITLIYFNKISTGLLMASGLSYLYLRKEWSLRSVSLIMFINIIVFAGIYITIFPNDRVGAQDSLIHRYHSVWKHSQGIFDYLSGLLIFLFYIFKRYDSVNLAVIRSYFTNKPYLFFEFLTVVSVLGLMGSWAVSNHGNDVIYCGGVQLYLCFPVFAYFLFLMMEKLKMNLNGKIMILVSLTIFSVLAKPEAFKSLVDFKKIKSEGEHNYNTTYAQLARRLKDLYKTENRKQTCVYIPHTEKWFFEGLNPDNMPYRDEIESPFVVPALSGLALIGGVPQSVLDSDYPYYGVYFHRLQRHKQVVDDTEAIRSAKGFGYKKMIKFSLKENVLSEQLIEL